MKYHQTTTTLIFILTTIIFSMLLTGCGQKKTNYRFAEVYLDCENYSTSQNDPGNCQVVPGTTSGLRVQDGMVVTKEYVEEIMGDLGWTKVSHTQKYTDVDGVSFRIEVYKYKRAITN